MPNFSHSNRDDIYLLALFKNQDLKHGLKYILIVENIVRKLKVLESDGILINGNINIYGTLVVSLAFDNLGGNQLLGFSGSFNAHYFCRFCEMLKEITKKSNRRRTNFDEDNRRLQKLDCRRKPFR
jgi:hypothetical protein